MRYHSTNKTVYSANYHLIWCPKYRRRILVGGVDARLKAIIAEVGAEVIEIEVMPDHVHLLAELPPTVPLSEFVRLLKGRSSRLLKGRSSRLLKGRSSRLLKGRSSRLLGMEFPRLQPLPVLCSPPWVVSTIGGAPLEVVRRYVGNQQAVAAG
jgi:putative transposase